MRIIQLELQNFRTFSHVVLEDIPSMVVLVAANGLGKSSILEAIAGAHDLVQPYRDQRYPFRARLVGSDTETPVWPENLPDPVRVGAKEAKLSLTVEPNDREQIILRSQGIEASIGKASFTIEHGRHIVSMEADNAIKALFRYHPLSEGVGFVDYNPPVRWHMRLAVGDIAGMLTDTQTQTIFSGFGLNVGDQRKFLQIKSFVMACQLQDDTYRRETGHDTDSLGIFRKVFDTFFAPKRFIGTRYTMGSTPMVIVQTPFGEHDIDDLSDGEKEILRHLIHWYRFREQENIVLWDTPESHLNAALEARLYDALIHIAPGNQWWIATHSLELLNSVPLDNVFAIRLGHDGAQLERAKEPERKTRIAIYRDLGAQVGLQLVSSVVVFVEGKEQYSDKRILERLINIPNVNFVAGHSSETVV